MTGKSNTRENKNKMTPSTSKNYSLSPTVIFVVIGFILLLGVILLSDYINQPDKISLNWPWLGVSTSQAASVPAPEAVINQITSANQNFSAYPEYLKDASYAMKKVYEINHPQFFITQN